MAKKTGHNRAEAIAAIEPYRAYLDELRQHRRSENTLKSACFAFTKLNAFLKAEGTTLQDLATDDLDRFRGSLAAKPLAEMTADLVSRQVRRFFRWLAASHRIFLDPAASWSIAKPVRPILYAPSEEEMKKLLAQPDVSTPLGLRDRAFIEVAYSSGGRLEELTHLTIFDPELDRGSVRVLGKGRKERVVPLGRQAVFWLKQYLKHGRPKLLKQRLDLKALWIGAYGEALEASALRAAVGILARRAGLRRISPHAIRRACATHMLRHGTHPVQIQFLLGHAGLNTLSQYLRVSIADMRRMHRASKPGG